MFYIQILWAMPGLAWPMRLPPKASLRKSSSVAVLERMPSLPATDCKALRETGDIESYEAGEVR